MEDNLQAVVDDPKEDPKALPKDGDAREESLDDLLNEFKEAETQPEQKQETSKDDLNEVVSFLKQERDEKIHERTNKDVDEAVTVLKSELDDLNISERALKRMLNGAAGENPRLRQAWLQRHDDPAQFSKVLKGLAKDFRSDFSQVDKDATEDREAVAAAVRSASTQTPSGDDFDDKKVKGMSDAEFETFVSSMG